MQTISIIDSHTAGEPTRLVVDGSPDRWKEREAEFRAIWAGLTLRNDRIRAVVPITFRPLDDSLRDCVESLIAVAGVEPNRRRADPPGAARLASHHADPR